MRRLQTPHFRPTSNAFAACLASSGSAFAQSDPAAEVALPVIQVREAPETATGPVPGYVARRTATATKTDVPLIEVPQSVSIVPAEQIQTIKPQSLVEALGYTAGVGRDEGADRTGDGFTLRGFQASAYFGSVRSRGIELEARGRVAPNMEVIAAYAYTDARVVETSPATPEQLGRRNGGSPYNQLSVWADYSFGAFGLPGLKAGAGVQLRRRKPRHVDRGRRALLHPGRPDGQLHDGSVALRPQREQRRRPYVLLVHVRLLLRRTAPRHRHGHLPLVSAGERSPHCFVNSTVRQRPSP